VLPLSSCGANSGDVHSISSDDDNNFPVFSLIDGYSTYESSPGDVVFSQGFLNAVTVQQCLDVTIPPVLPDARVRLVGWSRVVPSASHFLIAGGCTPSLRDIRLFIGDMSEQFAQGNRSVVIEVQGNILLIPPSLMIVLTITFKGTSFRRTFEMCGCGQMCCSLANTRLK
jgi:hypothetical protein